MVYMRGTIMHRCSYFVKFSFSPSGVADAFGLSFEGCNLVPHSLLSRLLPKSTCTAQQPQVLVALGSLILDAMFLSYWCDQCNLHCLWSFCHSHRGYHGEWSIVVVEASVCRRRKCRSSGAMQFAGNSGTRGVVCESASFAAEKEVAARTSGMACSWEPPSPHQVWASTSIPHDACRQVWGPHVSSLGYVHVPSHAWSSLA